MLSSLVKSRNLRVVNAAHFDQSSIMLLNIVSASIEANGILKSTDRFGDDDKEASDYLDGSDYGVHAMICAN